MWTKVQYSIFIKSPPRGSSDLIYKIEQRKKNEEKTKFTNLIVNNKWKNRKKNIKLRNNYDNISYILYTYTCTYY